SQRVEAQQRNLLIDVRAQHDSQLLPPRKASRFILKKRTFIGERTHRQPVVKSERSVDVPQSEKVHAAEVVVHRGSENALRQLALIAQASLNRVRRVQVLALDPG